MRLADSTLSGFATAQAADDELAIHDWPLPADWPTRGVALIVHGLGEHAGRYQGVAQQLNQWGYSVRAYDQYGHGESSGPRGHLPDDDRLVNDLAAVIDDTRTRMDDDLPLVLVGHGMGGAVAARLVAQQLRRVDALVLSSPAFGLPLTLVKRALLRPLHRLAPQLRVCRGADAQHRSHDPEVASALHADPLMHDHISVRMAHFITSAGAGVVQAAPRWNVPTLLLYAGLDRMVDLAATQAFVQHAPPGVVQARLYPMHYHELFNELDCAMVFEPMGEWLRARRPLTRMENSRPAVPPQHP